MSRPRAGGGRCRLCRRGAPWQRHVAHDAHDGGGQGIPPFAPPFLKAGKLVIGQTANILLYLGSRHGLAPKAEAGKLAVHQLQLTISDLVPGKFTTTHHPLGSSLYYEDQKPAAKKRTEEFWRREYRNIWVISSTCSAAMAAPTSPAAA
jgi:hypothetical protein